VTRLRALAVVVLPVLCATLAHAQPGVANRCVLWGAVTLENGSRSLRFAPEPVPDGPYYLHYIITLNGRDEHILTELAPKWDPREDVNIPGNGFYGCELGNFTQPDIKPGDKVQVVVTDEAAGQQGTAEVTVPDLPGAINCDVRLATPPVAVPRLVLRNGELVWDQPAPVTLVYERLKSDRYANGKPRGQYSLGARLTGGETSWRPPEPSDVAWLIVQKDAEGRVLGRSREVRTFREPDGFESLIAVTDSGMICTVDVGAGSVTVRDPGSAKVRSFPLREGTSAARVTARGETLEVRRSTQTDERDVYSFTGEFLSSVGPEGPMGPPGPVPASIAFPRASVRWSGSEQVVIDGLQRELVVAEGGKPLRTFTGAAFGGFVRPRALALHDTAVYILDGPRIVVVPQPLEEETPSVTRKDNRALVRWRTGAPVESRVTLTGHGTEASFSAAGGPKRVHEVALGDVPRPGKYRVSVSHSIRILGAEPSWAEADFLVPPSRKGYHAYLRVKLAMVIYANTGQSKDFPQGIEWPGPVSDAEIERLKNQMLLGQRFYWINSHLRFFPEMDFIIDREFHDIDPYGDYPSRQSLADLFAREGKRFEDYAGLCRIAVGQAYDADAKAWRISGRGGGLTMGLTKGSKDPGWSWWPACAADYFIPGSWLFTHEYGHQVDAMFDASGEPSFWGNHFAPQEGNVARFGEHFDGMAYVLRWWPEEKWFTSDWGTVEFAADADEDGVPDDAPELPLDEKRLGSDPHARDTDGDGLSDRDEVMAWNGVLTGLGQTWAQPILPNLRDRDTDRDGKPDGADPYPLYPVPATIPHHSLVRDDRPTPSADWPVYHRFEAQGVNARTSLAWDDDCLYVACRLDQPRGVFVQIDAADDGWFISKDNYRLTVEPPKGPDQPCTVQLSLVNAAVPGKWPFNDETLVKPDAIHCWADASDGYALVIAIPKSPETGLDLKPGETIGLNVGYAHPTLPGMYLTLFEPHRLVSATLKANR
jgi:hypothetical protein